MTFKEWGEEWLATYKKPYLKPNSYESLNTVLTKYLYPELGNVPLNKITGLQLQKTLNAIQFPRQKDIANVYLNDILKSAVINNLIKQNPATAIKIIKHKSTPGKALTLDDQKAFLEGLENEPNRLLFLLYISTGLRRNEALALRPADIDFKNLTITVKYSLTAMNLTPQKLPISARCRYLKILQNS